MIQNYQPNLNLYETQNAIGYIKQTFQFELSRRLHLMRATAPLFVDPATGLNENTNDLIRFFFPKGTDFLLIGDEEVQRVVSLINSRPRKTLDYLSPLEFFSKKCCT